MRVHVYDIGVCFSRYSSLDNPLAVVPPPAPPVVAVKGTRTAEIIHRTNARMYTAV